MTLDGLMARLKRRAFSKPTTIAPVKFFFIA
jgi:hypothetical protein